MTEVAPDTSAEDFTVLFVCQAGELEIKALLLAASLKKHLRGRCRCVAAVPWPEGQWGRVSPQTYEVLADLGVAVVGIVNPVGAHYPIGNKIACLGLPVETEYAMLLDSDIVCLRPFAPARYFGALDVYAKAADMLNFGQVSTAWEEVYRLVGMPLPRRQTLTTLTHELGPPYFNSGVVIVRGRSGLGREWARVAHTIDRAEHIGDKYPWLDQVALPVAIERLGLSLQCLDERFNYPLHLKPLPLGDLPFLCHYHWPKIIRREPRLGEEVRDLLHSHPGIAAAAARDAGWKEVLDDRRSAGAATGPAKRARDLLITGIPRSGTSYLCARLHEVPNVVTINEPEEIFAPLQNEGVPYGIACYYDETRRRILDGFPVKNKVADELPVEDTARMDERRDYRPRILDENFVLGTKNTLAYISRLEDLRRALPRVTLVACVRHPLDTIASWMNSFDHLAAARVEDFPVGGSCDRWLSGAQRERLQAIRDTSSPALRRALLWAYLAGRLLEYGDGLLVIRYEDLVTRPGDALVRILEAGMKRPDLCSGIPAIPPSSVRCRREVLTAEDLDALHTICAPVAIEFNYRMP